MEKVTIVRSDSRFHKGITGPYLIEMFQDGQGAHESAFFGSELPEQATPEDVVRLAQRLWRRFRYRPVHIPGWPDCHLVAVGEERFL